MPKKISDVAIERVPSLCNRISSFQSKLAIAHYAHGTITDYCHALYKAVVYIGKLPDDFSQDDVDGYLQSMYSKTLLSVIYDCGLRAFDACNLKWNDIYFDRRQVHVKKGENGKDSNPRCQEGLEPRYWKDSNLSRSALQTV